IGLEQAGNELVREIPLGWKQQLAFSVALLHRPGVVFLDEPTSGVDPITRRRFWELIYETAGEGTAGSVHHSFSRRGGALPPHFHHGGRDHCRHGHACGSAPETWRSDAG